MKLRPNYALGHIRESLRHKLQMTPCIASIQQAPPIMGHLKFVSSYHTSSSSIIFPVAKKESLLYCCQTVHTAPCIAGLNGHRSDCLCNIYWHLLVHGLTFQALFAVLKCQSTFLPQCPVMSFLKCMF